MSTNPDMPDVFVHTSAIVETRNVGVGSRIWAFSHVLGGAVIGADANICDHVFVENRVSLGARVTVKSGVQLWDGVEVEDDVFIGPNASFANDARPRSKQHLAEFPATVLRQGCSVGAGAVILPGVTIGRGAMVGAGAVVTRDVPPYAIAYGNPARIQGYVDASPSLERSGRSPEGHSNLTVRGVEVLKLRQAADLRGSLTAVEVGDGLPFLPRRLFLVHDVPTARVRGEHAHRVCQQLLISVAGACHVVVDDGEVREEVILDGPGRALFIPPMVWATQYLHTGDSVLLVAASHEYDPSDYFRDYDEWLKAVKTQP